MGSSSSGRVIHLSGIALLACVLVLFVLLPIGTVLRAASEGWGHTEPGLSLTEQRSALAIQTFALVMLTLLISLPVGTLIGIVLDRKSVV